MEERLVNHVQHGAAPQSRTPVRAGAAPELVPGGSPTPAQISQRYGVIEVESPRSKVPAAEGDQPERDDSPSWYKGPWGALLCDLLCFKDDFARKTEAVWWESISGGQQ